MVTILKKEFLQYFISPMGYVYLGAFAFFSGVYFFTSVLAAGSTDISRVYAGLFPICLFLVPILTMRIFSEERRMGTDQALFAAPLSTASLVWGKYLSAWLVFGLGASWTMVFSVWIDCRAAVDWAVAWGNYMGLLLLGAALAAMGMFVSSLTENQLVAAVGGIGLGLALMLVQGLAQVLPEGWLRRILIPLSLRDRYERFTMGILELADIVFFLSMTVLFVFLTIMRLENGRRR